jgi:predicted GNAT family N-acyltransferase
VPLPPHRIEPLQKTHDRTAFDCGISALNLYLQQQARQDAEKHVAAPFVLVAPPAREILGYYTLSASVISADELPPQLIKKMPRYRHLPVTLLGRLAVDRRARGQGMGEFLLLNALHRSLEASTDIAAMAIVVDAKDDAAVAFYRHFNFLSLQQQPRRLFLTMKMVAEVFAD